MFIETQKTNGQTEKPTDIEIVVKNRLFTLNTVFPLMLVRLSFSTLVFLVIFKIFKILF